MFDFRTCTAAALLTLAMAVPASAAEPAASGAARGKPTTSIAIPEPANIALFAAGVIGLLLGRRGSRSRHDGE